MFYILRMYHHSISFVVRRDLGLESAPTRSVECQNFLGWSRILLKEGYMCSGASNGYVIYIGLCNMWYFWMQNVSDVVMKNRHRVGPTHW
jgi:hypothetical protein